MIVGVEFLVEVKALFCEILLTVLDTPREATLEVGDDLCLYEVFLFRGTLCGHSNI